jgi:hypothetical protein
MTMRSFPLIIKQGRTLQKPFRRRYRGGANDGQVIDFTAHGIARATLQVRTDGLSAGGDLLLDLDTDNGGIVLGAYTDTRGELWSGYLSASATATADLTPWGEAQYDLVLQTADGLWVKTIFAGPALLIPTVTDWEA